MIFRRRRFGRFGSSAATSPVTDADIYAYAETDTLGLANNAAAGNLVDQSAGGHDFNQSAVGCLYKTNILNGKGVIQTDGAAHYIHGTVGLANQTILMLCKCMAVVDTNDAFNNSAVATRLRMANPGYDWYANSASGVQAVGGTTLTAFSTILIRATGAALVIRINGVQRANFTAHPNWSGNQIMRWFQSMSAQFAALGRWSADIGDARCAVVESYLKTKYNHY